MAVNHTLHDITEEIKACIYPFQFYFVSLIKSNLCHKWLDSRKQKIKESMKLIKWRYCHGFWKAASEDNIVKVLN